MHLCRTGRESHLLATKAPLQKRRKFVGFTAFLKTSPRFSDVTAIQSETLKRFRMHEKRPGPSAG